MRINRLFFFVLFLTFVSVGCSILRDDRPPSLVVSGDMTEDEARNWIIASADCLDIDPQLRGRIKTIQMPGNSFDWEWTDYKGNKHKYKNIGGVCDKQPDGSFIIAYVNSNGVKLHEFRHYNLIVCCRDYSEPSSPFGWCPSVQSLEPHPSCIWPITYTIKFSNLGHKRRYKQLSLRREGEPEAQFKTKKRKYRNNYDDAPKHRRSRNFIQ